MRVLILAYSLLFRLNLRRGFNSMPGKYFIFSTCQ